MKVGDVVLLRSPTDPEKILIKRVLGVAGDEILTRAPYPKPRCPIPTNHLWVEGDNIHSVDSNNFGPVSTGLVIGKATRIVFPPSRFRDHADNWRQRGADCRAQEASRPRPGRGSRVAARLMCIYRSTIYKK